MKHPLADGMIAWVVLHAYSSHGHSSLRAGMKIVVVEVDLTLERVEELTQFSGRGNSEWHHGL